MDSLDKYVVIVDRFGVSESMVFYVICNLILFKYDYLLSIIILWLIF